MSDRRGDNRSYVRFLVKVTFKDGREADAGLVDHSIEGIGLIVRDPIGIGDVVEVVIGADRYLGDVRFCKRLEAERGYSVGVDLASRRGY